MLHYNYKLDGLEEKKNMKLSAYEDLAGVGWLTDDYGQDVDTATLLSAGTVSVGGIFQEIVTNGNYFWVLTEQGDFLRAGG